MAISITIENLDEEVVGRLRAEAQRRGVDWSELVRERKERKVHAKVRKEIQKIVYHIFMLP